MALLDKKLKKPLLLAAALVLLLGGGLAVYLQQGEPEAQITPAATEAPVPALSLSSKAPEGVVWQLEGDMYFPDEENWVYHFTYDYPQVGGESYAALMVNDTYKMALDEMTQLVLPMFANSPDMRYDGKNEVHHTFDVKCNNGRFLSILQKKSQTRGEEGTFLSLESLTFDMNGEYQGESLTLRGVVMVGDSTDQIAAAVLPEIYAKFQELQTQGICRSDADRETFELEFSPAIHFYADEEGRAVFYLPPVLMAEPAFDTPVFPYTPSELEALLK